MSKTIQYRAIAPGDYGAGLSLNNAAVPNVNALDADSFAPLIEQAAMADVAVVDEVVAALMVVLPPGATYASANYRWFDRRFQHFLYVDRVVVGPQWRGCGLGAGLYARLFDLAADDAERIVCEVNLEPPNPGSLAFHQRLGFEQIARQVHEAGVYEVAMLAKPL